MPELPPVLVMWLGLVILPFLPRDIRPKAFILFPLAALVMILITPVGAQQTFSLLGYELVLLKVTQLSRVFGIIFALIAFMGGIYSMHMKETGQQISALIYSGGALGVTFSGDFFTVFIFWELMAIGSTYLIWARRTQESRRAGMRYLLMHLFGGSLLMAGIIMHSAYLRFRAG
ncbi:MAG: proton-conducting transporter membrane subunit [Desulfonatronovibrio sp.]